MRPPPTPAGAEHELGRVLGDREVEQCGGDVVTDHLVIAAAEALDQRPLIGERGR